MLFEGVCEGGKVSLYLFLFIFIIIKLYRVFINMDFGQGNGRSGGVEVIPSIVVPAPIFQELKVGC